MDKDTKNNPPVEDNEMVLTAGQLGQGNGEIVVLTPSPTPEPEPTPVHYQMRQGEPWGQAQEPTPMQAPRQQSGNTCSSCGAQISAKVAEFSTRKFGRPLCMNCQKGGQR